MGFYGNIVNNINGSITPNVQFQFDKVVSNKFLLDNTAEHDDVYLGRYVLIDYDKDITETIPRVLIYNDKFYYYNEWEKIKNDKEIEDDDIIASKLSSIDTYIVNGYVYISEENNPIYQNSKFYQWKEIEGTFLFSDVNDLEEFKTKVDSKTTSFDFNTYIDEYYHYDSTVWQKVYVNNKIKYEMIAKLNSNSPEIEYEIIPPNKNGLSSVSSVQIISENKYKILLPMSVGFKINENPYYEIYIYFPNYYKIKNDKEEYEDDPGISYNENINYYDPQTGKLMKFHFTSFPSDIDIYISLNGKFQTVGPDDIKIEPGINLPKLYVLLSDFEINYYSYEDDNTINENIIKKPVSIYYNKDGLLKEQRVHSNNIIQNEIKVIQDGNSGYQYENNKVFYKINIDKDKFNELKNKEEGSPLYFLENNRYININNSHEFNENIQYYIYERRNEEDSSKEPIKDVNQLTINLPVIGDMVCEGWDKIYGVERKTGEYDYDYINNKITNENIPEDLNEDSNSIVGLMNLTKLNLQKLIENQNNNPTMQINTIANSIPLISHIKVMEDENGDPIIDENGEQKNQIQYDILTERSLLQNQIAENNFAIKSILDKTGLTEKEIGFTSDYIEVPNMTVNSYQKNLYYITKKDENGNLIDKDGNIISTDNDDYKDKIIYILDNREQYKEGEIYYTYKINRDSVINNTEISLQSQISTNSSKISTNSTNIANNENNIKANDEDLKNITDRIGLEFNPTEINKNNDVETGSAILSSDKLYKELSEEDIFNNFDILKKDKELYYKDNGEYKLVTDDYNENMTYYKLDSETILGLIKQNNILINNLAARLINLEKFIEEGHFLVTFGRKNKDFAANYQEYPIPGSKPSIFPSQDTSS